MGKGRHRVSGIGATGRFLGAWAVVIVLDVMALAGIARLQFNDGLARTFQSDSAHYDRFQAFSDTFAGHGADVFVLLETDSFARPGALLAVQDFVLELQLTDGVGAVLSPFSLPLPDGSETPPRLQPAAAPDLAGYLDDVLDRQPALARFLAPDWRSALIVVQTMPDAGDGLLQTIDGLAETMLSDAGVALTQTGYPVIRVGVIDRLFSDFVLLNAVGALCGTLVAAIALQSVLLAMFTAMASGTAVLWVLGLMGAVGVQINVITIALPVLIMVLSFADALHLSFETRRQVLAGNATAIFGAIGRVGPACILASVTTAIAFGVLALSPSALVSELGRAGALAALLSGLAVLVVHPLLYATLHRVKPLPAVFCGPRGAPTPLAGWTWLPGLAYRHPRAISAGALGLMAVSVVLYLNVQPSFSLYENTTAEDPSRAATARIAATFGPTGALHFMTPLDPAQPMADLRAAAAILARHAPDHAVFSLADIGEDIAQMPRDLRGRWISEDGTAGLVSVAFDYQDAAATRALAERIEAGLAADPEAGALAGARATGLEAMTTFASSEMLRDLNRGFLVAVAISGLLIAAWLRDPLAGLVALVPNVLPIAIVGAWLELGGRGLEFASGIALTIAFGLAIDDTVHVLNRLRLDLGGSVRGTSDDVLRAMREVVPALVITSAVLSFGFLGTLWASLPSLVYFGALSVAVFVLALLADLIVLPACIIVLLQLRTRGARK